MKLLSKDKGSILLKFEKLCKEILSKEDGKRYKIDETFENMGFDSLDKIELLINCEKEFEILISDEQVENINTPLQSINLIYEIMFFSK